MVEEQKKNTIERGEFIEQLKKRNRIIRDDDGSSNSGIGANIGLKLLTRKGWDGKSSMGIRGEPANAPIAVFKRPSKAGLGTFALDDVHRRTESRNRNPSYSYSYS